MRPTLSISFCAIVAALNGIILLGSFLPASAYRYSSFVRTLGRDFIPFSPSAVENNTIYYGVCDRVSRILLKRKECVLYRVRTNFSGGRPKEDKCDFALESDSGGYINWGFSKIDPLGRNRAIVRWAEENPKNGRRLILRLSIIDFSNCKIKTSKISQDLNRLIEHKSSVERWSSVHGIHNRGYRDVFPTDKDFNWPMYLKGEDDFEIMSIVHNRSSYANVLAASINVNGAVTQVNTLLPPTFPPARLTIYPLSKGQGYLYIASESSDDPSSYKNFGTMTVAHTQHNGEMRNLTRIEDVYTAVAASVSLANGMIGICARQNLTTMQCTQFRLDDQEIKWFPVSLDVRYGNYDRDYGEVGTIIQRAIYNLPRGEGFLTQFDRHDDIQLAANYLLKIGLDGKVKQFLDTDMNCEPARVEVGFSKIFEDTRGEYCVSTTCVQWVESNYNEELRVHTLDKSTYVRLRSKCFEPEDFKNVSKYEVIAEYLSGYPKKGGDINEGIIKYDVLIE